MAIDIKSYNEILGDMVRKLIADTPLNDLNTGSVLLTLLEAAAQVDFENNASILSVLELLSIDAVRNSDLDARAGDFGLSRTPALKATGFVTIKDGNITKRSTGLYQVKSAPIAGSTQIFVNDASTWTATGNLFIGRDTQNFEGPVAYTSIVNNGSFFTINLASALQKDHLISDVVVDAQGTTDRLINAGSSIQIPANNQNPAITFLTLRNAVIPAGEDTVRNIDIVAGVPGSRSNAGINTIISFSSPPFTGAQVFNPVALTNGSDVESDNDLRERLKSYASTLARGTQPAILSAIIGVSDTSESKQVASAVITEPPRVGDPSIIYIDDGSGFQPSFVGQSVDKLLGSASGNEEFLQLSNFPLPRPQVINTADGPYELRDGMQFRVVVDNVEESITFSANQFVNITAARISEVIIAINDQSDSFKATFTETSSRMLLFPVQHDAEIIQVSTKKETDNELLFANNVLKFPTNEYSYISLYQNNMLLNEREKAATLLTSPFSSWNISIPGNLIVAVDGTPSQNQGFSISDFGGSPFATLNLENWVTAFNAKYAGITATSTSSGRMQLTSNKEGSASKLEIVGGTYIDKLFSTEDRLVEGQNSDFQLNRQTGNLRILTDILAGDSISAGVEDAKGSVFSTETLTGNYNISVDSNSRDAEIVVVPDSKDVVPRIGTGLAIGNTLTVTDEGSYVMRITSDSATSFAAIQPNDFLYITSRGAGPLWLDPSNCGLFKVTAKGEHTVDDVNTYIEVKNINIVPGVHAVLASEDIQAFKADTYPQLWKGAFTAIPATASIQDIVGSFNNNIVNIKASIFKTNSIKLTSTTEENGSIATPISVGRATVVFGSLGEEQEGNPSHIANRTASRDIATMFKRTEPTSTNAEGVSGKVVWLDRVQYSDIKGSLTDPSEPGIVGVDTYSEELQSTSVLTSDNVSFDDVYNSTGGANKGHYRSIRDKIAGDRIGTQHELPRTLMDHITNDAFNLMRPIGISAEDSIVFILDQDPVTKTIDIPMSRAGRINTSFPATNLSFSADDANNEPGITFGNLQVWGKTNNGTEFKNYSIWMRARNWYVSGGATSGGGSFILRSKEYGAHGENLRFSIKYPSGPNQANIITHNNNPDSTDITYFFGSDIVKSISLVGGDTFTVTSLGGNNYRYTFSGVVDLSTVITGDIIGMLNDSGVTAANRGQFRITAVNIPAKTIDIYNPNGAATTGGSPEITDITTVADVLGSQTVSTVADITASAALDGLWFKLRDSAGDVAVWYNVGTVAPSAASLGVNRVVEIGPLVGTENAATVTALTSGVIDADPVFEASYLTTTVTITNTENGAIVGATDGTSATGFTFGSSVGAASNSLNGKYFILRDAAGTVAFWYDTTGVTPEPFHGANRDVRISTVSSGDVAGTVASLTGVVIDSDLSFSVSILGNTITATDAIDGSRAAASAGTSGFSVAENTNGSPGTFETVTVPTSVTVFSLLNSSTTDIVAKINESTIVEAIETSATPITRATKDEVYAPAGPSDYSVSLAYGHDPDPSNNINGYVSFYDGINYIKEFENTNPNFVLKTETTLQGVAPSAYSMVNAPNNGTADLGEFFKLVPTTLNNVYHHFTQKALSQLPIVAGIDISNNIRKIQIKSKQLGSAGSVEVVGGNANNVEFSIFGEAQVTPGVDKNFLEVKTAAFPVTLTKNNLVRVKNDLQAKRLSRLQSGDTINVVKGLTDIVEYRYNPKAINTNQYVRFDISDVSATYSRPAGTVWRWLPNDGGSVFSITADVIGAPADPVADEIAAGGSDAPELERTILDAGTASTFQRFELTVSAFPTQASYFTFDSNGVSFAVWFSVDANVTIPTGATYGSANNKIMVPITTGMTEDQVVSALSTTLLGNIAFLANFSGFQTEGTNFDDVNPGDLLSAYGTFPAGWSSGNKAKASGDGAIAGLPIINVDDNGLFVDVVNPDGVAMSDVAIGTGFVAVFPTPIIQWNLGHAAKTNIVQIALSGPLGTATVTTTTQHGLKEGDTFIIEDNGIAQTAVAVTIPSATTFTFVDTLSASTGTYILGNVINSAKIPTRYKIESLNFNGLSRLSWVDGNSPRFVDCGVAVDDMLTISGDTFNSGNSNSFRVIGVDNTSIVYENINAIEELNTLVSFNNLKTSVIWTANSNLITGLVSDFKNVSIGDWVKKVEDGDNLYVQVISLLNNANSPVASTLATKLLLGDNYGGTTATTQGVSFDQNSDVGKGVYLQNIGDISIYEGDSVQLADLLFVDKIANTSWFSSPNSGTFTVTGVGTDGATYKPFVRVKNVASQNQINRAISVAPLNFFIIEGENSKYSSIRKVEHTAIDSFNENRRVVYMTPATSVYKLAQSSGTKITPIGKLNYNTDVTTGIDGYTYYTGLLRTVQRIVDGFEPEPVTYPGRRAVGGVIEILPPLIKRVVVSVEVTTNEGVNLNEITNDIKSAIINYIDGLGVGEDVILSEITVKIMSITGVSAITFNVPSPSTERISVSDQEKAFIETNDISIA